MEVHGTGHVEVDPGAVPHRAVVVEPEYLVILFPPHDKRKLRAHLKE